MSENLNKPLVSIAMATYNGAVFLQKQLDSLLAQTYKNIEIIISDDCSTDETISIIETYKNKFPAIYLYKNGNEKGVNKNFENAIKNCKGEYIALCDQDDIWLPHKIETLVNNIGDAALIYHNSLFVDKNEQSMNKTIADKLNCYSGDDSKIFLLLNCISGHTCMFTKKNVDKALPIPSNRFFDWWLAFIASENGGVKFIDEILVHYRQHDNSKTDMLAIKKSTKHKKEFMIYEQELEWFKNCAAVSFKNKEFYTVWVSLYENRKNQWFSFSLFLLTFRNMNILYFIKKKNSASLFFECLKLLWGLKLKTFIG